VALGRREILLDKVNPAGHEPLETLKTCVVAILAHAEALDSTQCRTPVSSSKVVDERRSGHCAR
jgi:hypothetical protein